MSPAELEYRLARSLDDYKLRRTQGDLPDPEDYRAELGEAAYADFLEMVEVERMLDDVLEPGPEETLPREFGPYTLIRELGRGAVGIVYEGVHRELGRHEAVKVLRSGFTEEGTALDRFRQEAKVLARVRHDHIVEIYGAGQVDGRPYYAMTLLEGRTLSQIARGGELPSYPALCRGLAGVADALHVLHERGVIHRDVKPSNILVTDEGRMVLADFGLARSLEDERMTRTGQALGTPLYMSPEQIMARRDEIDGRTDVYGLGASLYEVCAGRPAFQTDDLRALLQMILSERPEPLRKVAPQVPGPCGDIAMKAMEKKSSDRYPDAAAMRDDLLAFADGGRVRGRPVSPMRHNLRRVRRYALPIAAGLLAVLAGALWYVNRPGILTVTGGPSDLAVLIDGQEFGQGPGDYELDPGTYGVILRHERFEDDEALAVVTAGDTYRMPWRPPGPRRSDDPEAYRILAQVGGTDLAGLALRSGRRGGGTGGMSARSKSDRVAVALLPGGDVRPAGLASYYLEITPELEQETARLVFERTRDGERETLYDEPLGEQDVARIRAPLPEAVRSALRPGDVVTWGVHSPDGKTQDQTFTVVADDPALGARLAEVADVLQRQSPAVQAGFQAQVLLRAGLASEAYFAASAVTDLSDPTQPFQVENVEGQGLAWLVMRAALVQVSDLDASALGGQVNAVAHGLPAALRDALAADDPGADED